MSKDAELIAWIKQLDRDLNREYVGHKIDAAGNVTYVDLQETNSDNNVLGRLENLTHLRHLNICGNPDVTDDGLAHLARLTGLEYLDAGFTNIGNNGLRHLKGLVHLKSLLLNGIDDEQFTDAGLSHLLPLTTLEELRVNGSGLTDASVQVILQFRNLKQLDISGTRITDKGYRQLQAGLPACKIERNSAA